MFMLFTLMFLPDVSSGQGIAPYAETSSWEFDDIIPVSKRIEKSKIDSIASLLTPSLALIHFYQKKISVHSISRCPFKTSCSHFAYQAIKTRGFVIGLAFFIDRYFYRENIDAYLKYAFYQTNRGILKLNDDFYLNNH